MAKPSGITTGDGTEAHPWEVHNYEEIKWACEDAEAIPEGQTAGASVYLKLVNDVDCQEYDIDFLFSIGLTHSVSFDMNNKTIKTFYISNNSSMFTVNQYLLDIHDGKILNVYGYWDGQSRSMFTVGTSNSPGKLELSNLSISVNATKLIYIITTATYSASYYTIRNCAFWITGITPDINYHGRLVSGNVSMTCCDFYLDDVRPYSDLFRGVVATNVPITSQSSVLSNCRFQGTCVRSSTSSGSTGSGTSSRIYYVLGCHTIFRNCVWDLNITTTAIPTTQNIVTLSAVSSTSNSGLYNVDKWDATITMPANYIAAYTNEMDMRENPNADIVLQGMGFDVLKG